MFIRGTIAHRHEPQHDQTAEVLFGTPGWWRSGRLDYAVRALNCKADLPPLHLRRYVGPLGSFESSGAEFMGYLR